MALKNATTKSKNIFTDIQKCLAAHKAQRMIFDYDMAGHIVSIQFGLEINGNMIGFKLPAKVENVSRIMYGCLLSGLGGGKFGDMRRDQAYRTAWANIRDWISAQMAMIDTNQVKFEQVFLPYMIDGKGETMFEKIEKQQFLQIAN